MTRQTRGGRAEPDQTRRPEAGRGVADRKAKARPEFAGRSGRRSSLVVGRRRGRVGGRRGDGPGQRRTGQGLRRSVFRRRLEEAQVRGPTCHLPRMVASRDGRWGGAARRFSADLLKLTGP